MRCSVLEPHLGGNSNSSSPRLPKSLMVQAKNFNVDFALFLLTFLVEYGTLSLVMMRMNLTKEKRP